MKWPVTTLGAVCDIVSGATPKTGRPEYWNGDIAWATPKDLSDLGTKEISRTARCISQEGQASCSSAILPTGSVLFSSRAPIGLVAINTIPMCTNQGFKSMVPRGGTIDAQFLYWWLLANKGDIQQLGRGATFKEVSKQIVSEIEVPLPPLPEQKRIAAILDAADSLRAKRRASIEQLDSLVQATFLEMFGDPVTNPKGWEEFLIGDRFEVKGGKRLPKGDDYSPHASAHPYIRVSDLRPNWIATENLKYLKPETHARIAKYIVGSNDVVISIAGTLGVTAPVPRMLDGANLTENAARITPKDGVESSATFLSQFLLTEHAQNQIKAQTGQVTIGKLALFRIERMRILAPPLDLQTRFASIVEGIEQQKTRLKAHLAELDTLFSSLQTRAFNGELAA